MLAALMIFHVLLLRQFIEAMIFRRFDLSGGPREYYEFRIVDNVSGLFGQQVPVECTGGPCRTENILSKGEDGKIWKLVDSDDPRAAALKDM